MVIFTVSRGPHVVKNPLVSRGSTPLHQGVILYVLQEIGVHIPNQALEKRTYVLADSVRQDIGPCRKGLIGSVYSDF